MAGLDPIRSGQWSADKKPHGFKVFPGVWEVVGSSPTMTVKAG